MSATDVRTDSIAQVRDAMNNAVFVNKPTITEVGVKLGAKLPETGFKDETPSDAEIQSAGVHSVLTDPTVILD